MTATAMSHGTEALFFLVALVAFLVACVLTFAETTPRKITWPTLVAFGLAAWVFVLMWNAFAAKV